MSRKKEINKRGKNRQIGDETKVLSEALPQQVKDSVKGTVPSTGCAYPLRDTGCCQACSVTKWGTEAGAITLSH